MKLIPVTESLPLEEQDVLCYASKFGRGKYGSYHIGYYDPNTKKWMYEHCGKFVNYNDNPDYWYVTHWCELPKSPESVDRKLQLK